MGLSVYMPKDGTLGQGSGDTPLGNAFIQERVALYALGGFLLALALLVFRIASALAIGRLYLGHPTFLWHGLCVLTYLTVWSIARRGRHGLTTIRALDYAGLFLNATWIVLLGQDLPLAFRPEYVTLSSLNLVLMPRAIFVPGTARQTGVVAALMGLLLLGSTYFVSASIDVAEPSADLRRELGPRATLVRTGSWWALVAGLAALTSHVIYGLQREIRRARRLGQYPLEEKLGEGGMGVVYRASHAMLRRPTAVKLLAPEKAGALTIARFEREVRLTARLANPNTVTIYDHGRTPEGVFYYAMELLEGATLEQIVEACGPQAPGRVVHIASQVASALCEAHGLGLIHRDIKPANVILCERGGVADMVKVVDFGLVKEVETDRPALSQAGMVSGTPLYYLLAGEHVFAGRTTMEICAHHLHTEPVPIAQRSRQDLAPALAELVMACLAKAPTARPQSAEQVLERLEACPDVGAWSPVDARPWWKQHGAELRGRRTPNPVSGQSTIAVDLQHR